MRAAAAVVVTGVLSCALAAGGFATGPSAPAQSPWALTDLGTLAGNKGTSFAFGINNRGQVVGYSSTRSGADRAFLWQRGRMRGLGTLPGYRHGSSANAINGRGQIVGTSWGATRGRSHAFLWQDGTMHDLGALGGTESSATAINDRGEVVGTSTTAEGKEHAFLWRDGEMRDLGSFWPFAINDRGQVVGVNASWVAVLWEHGTLRDLGPAGRSSQASGIDAQGRTVGVVGGFVGCNRLAVWTEGRPLPTVAALRRSPCAGGNHDVESRAAINGRGQVAATGEGRAYVWQSGLRFALRVIPGAQRSIAVAINDRGQVVGASGWSHHFEPDRAVLWTPVPAR